MRVSSDNNFATSFSYFYFFVEGFISQAAKLGTQGAPACRFFSFEELKDATNNFDSSRFLGEGSMGKVTVKNLNMQGKYR